MKALLTLVVLGLFNFDPAFAQVSSATSGQLDSAAGPASHLMKHALFVCQDTTYEISYEPLGEFNGLQFYREWLGPEHFRWQGMAPVAFKSDAVSPPIIFRAEVLPGVDTVRSLFPSTKYAPPVEQRVGYNVFEEDALTEDAFLAFALRAFGLVTLDSAAAYFFGQADETLRPLGKPYVLCEVVDWRSTSPLFTYTVGRVSPNGFDVVERDTLPVSPKDMERLKRKLNEFVGAEYASCVCSAQGTSDLLFVGGKKVVMAAHCRDHKKLRRKPEAMSEIRWLHWNYTQAPRNFFGFPKNK
ncbi:MAG: hypothetical protein KA817_04885 [Flavobacteriales bacterium]|nr:hypothetical protein [Flavobacteriales bacterium]